MSSFLTLDRLAQVGMLEVDSLVLANGGSSGQGLLGFPLLPGGGAMAAGDAQIRAQRMFPKLNLNTVTIGAWEAEYLAARRLP